MAWGPAPSTRSLLTQLTDTPGGALLSRRARKEPSCTRGRSEAASPSSESEDDQRTSSSFRSTYRTGSHGTFSRGHVPTTEPTPLTCPLQGHSHSGRAVGTAVSNTLEP